MLGTIIININALLTTLIEEGGEHRFERGSGLESDNVTSALLETRPNMYKYRVHSGLRSPPESY